MQELQNRVFLQRHAIVKWINKENGNILKIKFTFLNFINELFILKEQIYDS